MKKLGIIIIFLFLLGGIIFIWSSKPTKNIYAEKGYTKEEIEKVESFSTDIQNYLKQEDYIAGLSNYWNQEDFKDQNFKKYLEFSLRTSLDVKETIYLVNHEFDDQIAYDETTISLMHEPYYIHEYLNRYQSYMSKNQEISQVIANVNANLDYEFYTQDNEVDLSKNYLILVNKYYRLNENYAPDNLVTIESKYGISAKLEATVYQQYVKMWQDASKEGLYLYINSPYRSYATQKSLYNNYVSRDGKKAADTYSARPGYSEHQTGLAFDVTSKTTNFDTFEQSKEFKWMQENAYKYGFILRYPKGKEYMTGYIYEPWHYRYVGEEVASKIKETGLTFEEYYAYYVR